jgi:multidrug efflux pump subunit AcrA (membrane-fusion protein)
VLDKVPAFDIQRFANGAKLAFQMIIESALQNDEKGKYIMVMSKENGKLFARKKMVTIGQFYGDRVEIMSGLTIGDRVITEGFQGLFDGQLITLQ